MTAELGGEPPNGATLAHMRNIRLDLAYNGSEFHGFAVNDGVRTVAGDLGAAIEKVLRTPVGLTCAGRTDRGVHAHGQVVNFKTAAQRLDQKRLRNALNSLLSPNIAVASVEIVDNDFDARFDALWRYYRYEVLAAAIPSPFASQTSWWIPDPLDCAAMNSAAEDLVGLHDFSAFCRRPKDRRDASLMRNVHLARWVDCGGDRLVFEIVAGAFCHQMVRSIVGTMVRVGRGRLRATEVAEILASGDRSLASELAPPQGLSLYQVGYDDQVLPDLLGA